MQFSKENTTDSDVPGDTNLNDTTVNLIPVF
jgi:hypothetical protein